MLWYACIYFVTKSLVLTETLIVFGFVSFPTKQGSSSFPEKAFGRAGDVEVRSRKTAAGRQCFRHEALCRQKLEVQISVLKTSGIVDAKSAKQKH